MSAPWTASHHRRHWTRKHSPDSSPEIDNLLQPLSISTESNEDNAPSLLLRNPFAPVRKTHKSQPDVIDGLNPYQDQSAAYFRFSRFSSAGPPTPPSESELGSPVSPFSSSPTSSGHIWHRNSVAPPTSAPLSSPPWMTPTRSESPHFSDYEAYSSSNIRAQRQRAIRQQCSSSHQRDVRALVARMIAKGDMCDVRDEFPATSRPQDRIRDRQRRKPEARTAARMVSEERVSESEDGTMDEDADEGMIDEGQEHSSRHSSPAVTASNSRRSSHSVRLKQSQGDVKSTRRTDRDVEKRMGSHSRVRKHGKEAASRRR